MEKKLKILPPIMPNVVRFEIQSGFKQHGFKANEGYDIGNFTEEEAIEFAELMYREFMKHWEERRKLPIFKRKK